MDFFPPFSHLTQFQKIYSEWTEKKTIVGLQITSRCTHFGFHRDKIKHLLNYWWNVNKVLPIRQENNKGKDFFFLPLFIWIKTISIEMQSYHTCQKNSTSEYEQQTKRRKWLLELERDWWWKPLKWDKFRSGPDVVLLKKKKIIHSNTSPYTAYQPQSCNHFSVWHTVLFSI